jgi:hypothetical protein
MVITAIEPARSESDGGSDDLEDVTHTCEQCGTTLTRLIRLMRDQSGAPRGRV